MPDFLGWSKWSPHVSNAIAIVTFIPILSGIMAGVWAYLSGAGLSVALAVLAVFVMTLWSCIGILVLIDRHRREADARLVDCSWGLRVDSATLIREVLHPQLEWQLNIQVRNVRSIPLKMDVLETRLVIENIVPTGTFEHSGIPFILRPGETCIVNFPGYRHGALPEKDRFAGIVDVRVRYGYPDGPYTRVMTRRLGFAVGIKRWLPPDSQTVTHIPVLLSPREEDRDETYAEEQRRR